MDNIVRQLVERFHLIFLNHFGQKLDKKLYVLKGGCNLRFFFKSIRYSEDIDIDVKTIARTTLENKIDNILLGQPLNIILAANKIGVEHISKPKQTDTTQRWKIILNSAEISFSIHTKIEFSRRGLDDGIHFDPIDPLLIGTYQLQPFYANHYEGRVALEQKIKALIGRNQTQARDIFDINLLLSHNISISSSMSKAQIDSAISNALSIEYEDYLGQVVAFLEPAHQQLYQDKIYWEKILNNVIGRLEKIK